MKNTIKNSIKNTGNNKGFSLVELIIVIAIMAILVGVIAPQLLKYIEKSRTAADVQLCDTLHTALLVAMSDPAVVNDDDSLVAISWFAGEPSDGNPDFKAWSYTEGTTKFAKAFREAAGLSTGDASEIKGLFKSKGAKAAGSIGVCVVHEGEFYVFINNSDASGEGGQYNFSAGLDKLVCAPLWKY